MDGCFLLTFDKLSRYGKKADEVWRRPTPTAPSAVLLAREAAREVAAGGAGQRGRPEGGLWRPRHPVW